MQRVVVIGAGVGGLALGDSRVAQMVMSEARGSQERPVEAELLEVSR